MLQNLEELVKYSETHDTDISSHLPTIYKAVSDFKPKLIVELGVRDGESSKVFDLVARETGCHVIGCDLEDCQYNVTNGQFIQCDDIKLAGLFTKYFGSKSQAIDVLFVDTSHLDWHTRTEIGSWFPLLADRALVIFHDTNLKQEYNRKNGSTGIAWNNERGVVSPLEDYLGLTLNEEEDFEVTTRKGGFEWRVQHESICNGLSLVYKSPQNLPT